VFLKKSNPNKKERNSDLKGDEYTVSHRFFVMFKLCIGRNFIRVATFLMG